MLVLSQQNPPSPSLAQTLCRGQQETIKEEEGEGEGEEELAGAVVAVFAPIGAEAMVEAEEEEGEANGR